MEILNPTDDPQQWRWRDNRGRVWTIDTLGDEHLVNIEHFLLGRDEQFPLGFEPGNPNWERSYDLIRNEINKRGLELKGIATV